MNDNFVNWALGYMLEETNDIPSTPNYVFSRPFCFGEYITGLVMFGVALLLAILGVVVVCGCYCPWCHTSSKGKYAMLEGQKSDPE